MRALAEHLRTPRVERELASAVAATLMKRFADAYSLERVLSPAALHVSVGTYPEWPRPREKREEVA